MLYISEVYKIMSYSAATKAKMYVGGNTKVIFVDFLNGVNI